MHQLPRFASASTTRTPGMFRYGNQQCGLHRRQEMHAEPAAAIGPDLPGAEARSGRQRVETANIELVRIFRVNALAFRELNMLAADRHRLPAGADQVHLHAAEFRIVECVMAETLEVKRAA